jgi:hypothetical protein
MDPDLTLHLTTEVTFRAQPLHFLATVKAEPILGAAGSPRKSRLKITKDDREISLQTRLHAPADPTCHAERTGSYRALKKIPPIAIQSIFRLCGSVLCVFSAQFHTPPFVHAPLTCLQFFTNPMFKMML